LGLSGGFVIHRAKIGARQDNLDLALADADDKPVIQDNPCWQSEDQGRVLLHSTRVRIGCSRPRHSNGEAIRGMVFKLGGRLPNTETWTLSPGAPETRRGLFLSSPLRLGLVAVFGKHGSDAL
jgi:hypothetical protein